MGAVKSLPTVPGIYVEKDETWLQEAWTGVPNALIRNPDVSWDAIGAFAWLASHQEMTFRVTAQLLADAGPRGRNHAYEMVRELEKWGWLTRHRLRNPETGYTDIQVYRLHPKPVPVGQRTYKPSKAKAMTTESIPDQPGTNIPAPGPEQTPSSEFIPDKPVTDRPVSTRPVPDQSGSLREKNKKEEQERGEARREPPEREGTPDPDAPPTLKADWRKPDTWLCGKHLAFVAADPGANVPPCPMCGRVRVWAERKVAENALAQADESTDEAGRARLCTWHDEAGWVLDPDAADGRTTIEPAAKCDHRRPPAEVKAASRRAGPGYIPPAEVRANAQKLYQSTRKPTTQPKAARRRRREFIPDAGSALEASA